MADDGSPVPLKCGQHTLKKVRFENFGGVEVVYQEKLKNYFVENAKMLQSIDVLNL